MEPYAIIHETRNITQLEIERHLEDCLMKCEKDCVSGDIIDNKIIIGWGRIEDEGFKKGHKVIAIPLDLIQEEYGFEAINIIPFRCKRYRNRNPH